MKRKTKDILIGVAIFTGIIIFLIMIGQSASKDKEFNSKTCADKLKTIESLKDCEYVGMWEYTKYPYLECTCLKDSQVQKYLAERNATR